MTTPPLISVVITTFNRSDALLAVLEGLSAQTDTHFEVIVADDGSRNEHVRPVLSSQFANALKATHVWHPDVGFTAARVRNRGVSASKGSYIVFMDGDCVPSCDFIARHRSLAKVGTFVNGSRVLLSERLSREICAGEQKIFSKSTLYWVVQRMRGDANKLSGLFRLPDYSWRIDQGVAWVGVRSCNMGVWRADFEKVDGFDESFVGWGHEDADFILRLSHSGVARKNGFWATEVFHLWHHEAARAQASVNAETVARRAKSYITQPTLGYSQQRPNDDVVITRLG